MNIPTGMLLDRIRAARYARPQRSHRSSLLEPTTTSRISIAALLAPASLAGFVLAASAQESRNSIQGSSFRDLPVCQSDGGASRARECEGESVTTTRVEKEFTFSVEQREQRAQCQANVASSYLQRNTLADIEGTIEVEGCSPASGEYTVFARIRDDNGDTQTLEFGETWQREDDQVVSFAAQYPIGENVELLSLRVREVRCACEDRERAAAAPAEQ